MGARSLRYRFEAGTSAAYDLHMRVTVQVESAGEGPVTQVAEVRGRIGLEVLAAQEGRARIGVTAEHLDGEVPSHGFFDQAAVSDPLSSLPGEFEVDARGETTVADGGADTQGSPLDALFPPVPEAAVAAGAMWFLGPDGTSSPDAASADEPGGIHCRYIGPEPGDDGVVRDVVGTFSGHAWRADGGIGGVTVQGETRRMSEVQLRREDGWAQRVDGRVETALVFQSPAEGDAPGESRTIDTLVELLLVRAVG